VGDVTAPLRLPFDDERPLQAAPRIRALHERGPVHEVRTATGDPAWLVTGYEETRRLLADPRLGRSHPDPARAARIAESALFGGPRGNPETEDADHARIRSLLQPHFAPARMRRFRPRVEALTAGLLDDLARRDPPADLVEALTAPLPILVICELLGVPYADRPRFRSWTVAAGDVRDRARSERGLADLFEYGRQLVARKSEQPGDDIISSLCATSGADHGEIAMLSMFLLFAGHQSTVAAIGLALLLLLTHQDQWRAVRDDPGRIPAAVEEMLRAPGNGGGGGIPRYARADLEIDGVTVRAGDLVLFDNAAANHDAAIFTDPGRFDVTRQAASHLTFGHGSRRCLGAPLARIELQAVITQLVSRFPDLRLATGADQLTLDTSVVTVGLAELPVTW
jgi:cytochrome P450